MTVLQLGVVMSKPKRGLILFNECEDNGYVMIRRNLYAHYHARKITKCGLDVMLALLIMAGKSTGSVRTCASVISSFYFEDWTKRQVQEAMVKLERDRYIKRDMVPGKIEYYKITVNKYEITDGPRKGTRVDIGPAAVDSVPNPSAPSYTPRTGSASTRTSNVLIEGRSTPVNSGACAASGNDVRTDRVLGGRLTARQVQILHINNTEKETETTTTTA